MPRASTLSMHLRSYLPSPTERRRRPNVQYWAACRDPVRVSGPVDEWLAGNRAREIGQPDSPLTRDEVRCYVQMDRQEGEVEGDFVDPDVYTLYLTITALHSTGVPGSYVVFPKVVLETYAGWTSSQNAPGWAQWAPGRQVVFRQTKEELLQFFLSMVPKKDGMDLLVQGIESIHL
ncbi:hypothetical protein BXZ70DRAFT_1011273 [Cristinia sonorae]|uniref:Uncharacterized protein n=1 Tax=Cristinia sonorae TaxID=1940300 RepID=A0A8K0UGS2_9AGAR|nr:hypothetical protein BXZ70DRAFT_1011273 [Cristinia sonorae]